MKTKPEIIQSLAIMIESDEKGYTNLFDTTVDFGSYFRPIFSLYYYCCFIPFKVVIVQGRSYGVKTNFFQKVLCVLIQTFVFLTIFGEIYGTAAGSNLESTLRFLDRINKFICCFLFFYAGWFKQNSIITIFGEPTVRKLGRKRQYCIIFVAILVPVFSIFAIKTSYGYVFNSENPNGFRDYMETLFFGRIKGEIPIELQILSAFILFGRLCRWILIDLITWLMDTVVFVALISGRNFKRNLIQSLRNSHANEDNIFRQYYQIVEMINRFNEFLGQIFLSNFIALIFYWAVSTVDALDSKSLAVHCVWAVYILSSGFRLIFAAEAHYQISYFKTWILRPERRCVLSTAKYLEIENSNVALRGGRFFAITYNFLGAASSVILTYAIMMIQFRGDKQSQS